MEGRQGGKTETKVGRQQLTGDGERARGVLGPRLYRKMNSKALTPPFIRAGYFTCTQDT